MDSLSTKRIEDQIPLQFSAYQFERLQMKRQSNLKIINLDSLKL